MRTKVLNTHGFSLIEALMAIAILGLSASFVGINMLNQTQLQRGSEATFVQKEFVSEVVDDLAFPLECQKIILPALGDVKDDTFASLSPPLVQKELKLTDLNNRYQNDFFEIEKATLDLDLIPGTTTDYSGSLNINLKAKPGQEGKFVLAKQIQIPIQFYVEDATRPLGAVSCFDTSNEIMQARSEMCSLLGGQLAGGSKCEFYRTRRPNLGGGASPAPTDLLETNPNVKVQKHDFMTLLCYLDSLVTRVPGLDDTTMEVYSTDSYNKVRRTTSCRYPGYVKAHGKITAANRASIFNDINASSSIQVRGIFTEDGSPSGGGSGGGGGKGCKKCWWDDLGEGYYYP